MSLKLLLPIVVFLLAFAGPAFGEEPTDSPATEETTLEPSETIQEGRSCEGPCTTEDNQPGVKQWSGPLCECVMIWDPETFSEEDIRTLTGD